MAFANVLALPKDVISLTPVKAGSGLQEPSPKIMSTAKNDNNHAIKHAPANGSTQYAYTA